MNGLLICYAIKCTEGLTLGEFFGGLALAVIFVGSVIALMHVPEWNWKDKDEEN